MLRFPLRIALYIPLGILFGTQSLRAMTAQPAPTRLALTVAAPRDPTRGPPPRTAASYAREGLDAFRAARYQLALELFDQARSISGAMEFVARMGFALQALGRLLDAEYEFQRVLAQPRGVSPEILRAVRTSMGEISSRVGTLEVSVSPMPPRADYRWSIDGGERFNAVHTIRLVAGSHVVRVMPDDHCPVTRTITIVAGTILRENFPLVSPPPRPNANSPFACDYDAGVGSFATTFTDAGHD